jgi:photosystem II stability/assembly factor-like uncharacterized protein
MKKIFTSLLILIVTLNFVLANSVSKTEAQQIAENFYSTQVSNKNEPISVSEVRTFEYGGEATMYIFSFRPNGFVIVSAENNAYPIIGYSLTNQVGNGIDNPSVIKKFELYSKQINQAKQEKAQNSDVKQQWENYKVGKATKIITAVPPLLTTTWDQSPNFNLFCPANSPTGCVATAMAQIMNYHEWPATGQGWHKYTPSSNLSYGTQYADFSAITYDWANMPDNLSDLNTLTEKNAIATLMFHAGVSVDMDYDPDGSGAATTDAMYALTSYFKYDPSTINTYVFDASNVAAWLTRVKAELDQSRPVLYSGFTSTTPASGHAWVCDGYDASDNLHINWGWGGSLNGYFAATAMTPNISYSFTESNSILTGITPNLSTPNILWVQQASAFSSASRGIQDISAVNDRVAWAVAYDGSGSNAKVKDFTRTIDGGSSWISGTINTTNTIDYSAAMISAVSDKRAWVALFGPSGGGKIVSTTDGGVTWLHQSTATFSAPNGFPNVVHFWNENDGFCMGDPNGGYFEIYTTTNGGTTWTRVSSANIPANSSGEYGTVGFYAVYGNTVWFATNKGRVYKSTDKGSIWVAYQTPITDASFELSFKDENIGIIQRRNNSSTDTSPITSWKTTDGGAHWTQITPTGNFYQNSFMFIPGSDLLLSTGSDFSTPAQGVSYSTDNGSSFTEYADFYKNFQFLALGAASDKSIWAGGYNSNTVSGGMWHLGAISISADFRINKTLANQYDSTIVFTDNSYGSPESWIWDFGDGASPQSKTGVGPYTLKYTTTGYKTITLTITKGAEEQIFVKENCLNVTWPVDVETTDLDKQYTVYPNPASVSIKINGYEKGIVQVYSTTGVLVMEAPNLSSNNSLNISSLNTGIYFIKIQTPNGKVVTKKLSISK